MAVVLAATTAGCQPACPTALFTGTLVRNGDTLEARPHGGGPSTPIVWPAGIVVRDVEGRLVVADLLGTVKAREGDAVRLGGGMTADNKIGVCGLIEVDSAPPP